MVNLRHLFIEIIKSFVKKMLKNLVHVTWKLVWFFYWILLVSFYEYVYLISALYQFSVEKKAINCHIISYFNVLS